jgi:ubiquinone/menaquinone biosynthesis C-methylase UbiE
MNRPHTVADGWQLEGNSAEAYERYLASTFSPWAQALVALAGVAPGDRVLDLACGTGIVARHAAKAAGAKGRVTGIDVNEGMLRVARSVTAEVRPAIEWHHGNAAALPFQGDAFDVVLCEQGLQFFSEPEKTMHEVRRVMAPGARVAASVCRPITYCPAYEALATALDHHLGPQAGAVMRSPFSAWELEDLRRLFTTSGLDEVRLRIEVAGIRYPSCEEFLRQEAACSPLAGQVSALTGEARDSLIRDLGDRLADHVDDDGVLCVIESYVALARRRD